MNGSWPKVVPSFDVDVDHGKAEAARATSSFDRGADLPDGRLVQGFATAGCPSGSLSVPFAEACRRRSHPRSQGLRRRRQLAAMSQASPWLLPPSDRRARGRAPVLATETVAPAVCDGVTTKLDLEHVAVRTVLNSGTCHVPAARSHARVHGVAVLRRRDEHAAPTRRHGEVGRYSFASVPAVGSENGREERQPWSRRCRPQAPQPCRRTAFGTAARLAPANSCSVSAAVAATVASFLMCFVFTWSSVSPIPLRRGADVAWQLMATSPSRKTGTKVLPTSS